MDFVIKQPYFYFSSNDALVDDFEMSWVIVHGFHILSLEWHKNVFIVLEAQGLPRPVLWVNDFPPTMIYLVNRVQSSCSFSSKKSTCPYNWFWKVFSSTIFWSSSEKKFWFSQVLSNKYYWIFQTFKRSMLWRNSVRQKVLIESAIY